MSKIKSREEVEREAHRLVNRTSWVYAFGVVLIGIIIGAFHLSGWGLLPLIIVFAVVFVFADYKLVSWFMKRINE